MSQQKIDEMTILKALSIKLDDDNIMIVTLQYHVEKGNRGASRYRYLGRVCRIEDLKKEIEELKKPENRLNGWKWPNDPSWDGKICTNDSTNDRAADWLKLKISKAIDWDLGQKVLQGWKTPTKKFPEGVYNPRAKYETEGYVCTDGTAVSLTDKETLLQKIGQNFAKEQVLKTRMPAMA